MDGKCTNMENLKNWQLSKLRRHISDNRHYMGEKRHHSVTPHDAELDFFKNYASNVCSSLRLTFCTEICPVSACSLREMFIEKEKGKT